MRYENGNAPIEAMSKILQDRHNVLWEVWDFINCKLAGAFMTEKQAAEFIEFRYSKFNGHHRVRYLILPPSSLKYTT